jgi:hypothetical protein
MRQLWADSLSGHEETAPGSVQTDGPRMCGSPPSRTRDPKWWLRFCITESSDIVLIQRPCRVHLFSSVGDLAD